MGPCLDSAAPLICASGLLPTACVQYWEVGSLQLYCSFPKTVVKAPAAAPSTYVGRLVCTHEVSAGTPTESAMNKQGGLGELLLELVKSSGPQAGCACHPCGPPTALARTLHLAACAACVHTLCALKHCAVPRATGNGAVLRSWASTCIPLSVFYTVMLCKSDRDTFIFYFPVWTPFIAVFLPY